MRTLRHAFAIVLLLPATSALAETVEDIKAPAEKLAPAEKEKNALAEILPQFKKAWNSGVAKDFMDLFHADCPMKKAYENNKERIERALKEMVDGCGNVESFEIRKYIEKKSRYVVWVKYAKKGLIPGTFAVKCDDKGKWLIWDFNIDGQGEPELKE